MRTIQVSLAAALLLAASFVSAQPPDTLWTSFYGDEGYDYGESVLQTDDGGFIIGGRKKIAGYYDMYIVKTDSLGVLEWENTYGGPDDDRCFVVVNTDDGGYLLAGDTESYGLGWEDIYLVKIDSFGNTEWEQTYGDTACDYCFSAHQTADGGYILAGKMIIVGVTGGEMILKKTDSSGNLLWEQSYNSGDGGGCQSVQITPDGGYILAGFTSPQDQNIYVVKTDSLGEVQWDQYIDPSYDVRCYDIKLTSDGGYILGGSRYASMLSPADIYLLKLDSSGDEEWEEYFGGNNEDRCFSLQVAADNGYVLGGETYSYGSGQKDAYLVKTDALGNMIWQQAVGSEQEEDCMCVQITSDGGYALTGHFNDELGWIDMYVVRFEPGGTSPDLGITLTPENPPIQIPVSGGSFNFSVVINNPHDATQIFDVWIMVTLPNGAPYGPVLGAVNLTLPGGITIDRDRIQAVPAGAPAGTYTYDAYAGVYPDIVWGSDSFPFEKLETGDGSIIGDWANYGEDFRNVGGGSTPALQEDFMLISSYPNPFNPTTTISFTLPEATKVNLSIYDISGRLVAMLADGWRDAGLHKVKLDGSDLPSGIYFARIMAGDVQQTEKLLLVK